MPAVSGKIKDQHIPHDPYEQMFIPKKLFALTNCGDEVHLIDEEGHIKVHTHLRASVIARAPTLTQGFR